MATIKILSHVLWKLNNNYSIYIKSIDGGGVVNAIPREANSMGYFKEEQLTEIKLLINSLFTEIKKNYEGIEENIQISTEEMQYELEYHVIPEFPSAIIMPLFMIISMLAVALAKRKPKMRK